MNGCGHHGPMRVWPTALPPLVRPTVPGHTVSCLRGLAWIWAVPARTALDPDPAWACPCGLIVHMVIGPSLNAHLNLVDDNCMELQDPMNFIRASQIQVVDKQIERAALFDEKDIVSVNDVKYYSSQVKVIKSHRVPNMFKSQMFLWM